ncbi:MAG: DUF3313 domain-containing protein [Planctomycetota bacterium]
MVLCAACGTTPDVRRSGFLDDYSKLAPVDGTKGVWAYESADLDLRVYKRVLVENTVAFFHPDADANEIDPVERKRLTEEFGRVLRNTLRDNGFRVVKEPGENTLRVRAAITDLYVKIAPLATEGSRAGRITLEGASMEADLKDSQSGKVLAAFMSARRGGGVQSFRGDAQQRVFQFWADNLVKLLTAGH